MGLVVYVDAKANELEKILEGNKTVIIRGALNNSNLAYSLWKGYFKKEEDFWNKNDVCVDFIHTSGHADLESLTDFVNKVKPANIIPVHTMNNALYEDYFNANVIYSKEICA